MRCTKPRQPALSENFNLPYGSHVKKHDTRFLIGRIAFLTCGKSDTRHLIGLHRFANENLLCGFSVCKSQYVYNKINLLNESKSANLPNNVIGSTPNHVFQSWEDSALSWKPDRYGNITRINLPVDVIWTPPVGLLNSWVTLFLQLWVKWRMKSKGYLWNKVKVEAHFNFWETRATVNLPVFHVNITRI